MELKDYQKYVIADLKLFLTNLNIYKNMAKAYSKTWEAKGLLVGTKKLPAYNSLIPSVPHVCFKVPTGGGKTYLACASIKPIYDAIALETTKIVVWLTPSEAIMTQTINNLKNPEHPYRQKLNADFANKVVVYTKEELLNGQNFSPASIRDQLSICVLSYDSFRTKTKDGRRAYRENGSLLSFAGVVKEYIANDEEQPSLSQVLRAYNPVMIVDESHHAQSDLSIEMIKTFNPSFVLDLTATPRENSNIISCVDALQLKKENMVKLPVFVYNQRKTVDVLMAAIKMQRFLEKLAKTEESTSGKYIRPIVLLQAQPKNAEDNETFEKIKDRLVLGGIPEDQIAIKTADVNELKNIDLLNKKCKIRYIITVNALKEGWDCSFAYVLATVANKSSAVDVEQIVGRILRQPYAKSTGNNFLNSSYVFTSSADFSETVNKVIEGLNRAGFSERDYRAGSYNISDLDGSEVAPFSSNIMPGLFADENDAGSDSSDADDGKDPIDEIDVSTKPFAEDKNDDIDLGTSSKAQTADAFTNFLNSAQEQNASYNNEVQHAAETSTPGVAQNMINPDDCVKVRPLFAKEIEGLLLPQFVIEQETDLFGGKQEILVNKQMLTKDFKLGQQNTQINFDIIDSEIYKLDLEDGNVPKKIKMSQEAAEQFKKELNMLPSAARSRQIATRTRNELSAIYNEIEDSEIKEYVDRIVNGMDTERLEDFQANYISYFYKIKQKIDSLLVDYRIEYFNKQLDWDVIKAKKIFKLQPTMVMPKKTNKYTKTLYEYELDDMNSFEEYAIESIIALENVKWWHRNGNRDSSDSYFINGYLNHYPDFIVGTEKGKVLFIETKGEHLANDDTELKLKLGEKLEAKAGNNFKYYMIFKDEAKFDMSFNLQDALEDIRHQ